jgi:lysophospholipase L1-like esterase
MPIGALADLPLPNFISSVDSATQITMSAAATNTNASRGAYIGAGTTITPDLWIIPIGHNDWQNQNHGTYPVSLSTFKTQMQRIIDTLVAAGGCVLLVGEPKSNNVNPTPNTYPDSDYWLALQQLASANDHVAAMQINRAWGTNAQAQALGLLSSAGGVHPIKKGSADMARLIFDVLVTAPQCESSPVL